MSDFKAVPYIFDRDHEVLELLHKVFSPWAGDQVYFDWKYKKYKPEGCTFPNAWIIEDKKKIIAFNGYIPRLISSNGKDYWAVQSFDTATDPDYRGKGLFGILQKQAYEQMKLFNINWVYGWTSEIGFKVFTKKMGWNVWEKQRFLMKVLDAAPFVRSKTSNPFAVTLFPSMLTLWNHLTKPSVSSQYIVKHSTEISESATQLIETHNKIFSMAVQKSLRYINWRASNPINRLKFLTIEGKDGNIAGLAAWALRKNCFDIDDMMVKDNNALKALLGAIENHAIRDGFSMIRFRVNSNHDWSGLFKRSGYFWSNTEFPLLGKKLLDDDFQTITDHLHWTLFDRNE